VATQYAELHALEASNFRPVYVLCSTPGRTMRVGRKQRVVVVCTVSVAKSVNHQETPTGRRYFAHRTLVNEWGGLGMGAWRGEVMWLIKSRCHLRGHITIIDYFRRPGTSILNVHFALGYLRAVHVTGNTPWSDGSSRNSLLKNICSVCFGVLNGVPSCRLVSLIKFMVNN